MSGLDNKKPSNEDHQAESKNPSFAEKIALLEAKLPQLGAPKTSSTSRRSSTSSSTSAVSSAPQAGAGAGSAATSERKKVDTSALEALFKRPEAKPEPEVAQPATAEPAAAPSRPALPSNLAAQLVAKAGKLKKADETTASSQPAPNAGAGQAPDETAGLAAQARPIINATMLAGARVGLKKPAPNAAAGQAADDAAKPSNQKGLAIDASMLAGALKRLKKPVPEPQDKKSDNKKPAVDASELIAAVKRRRQIIEAQAETAEEKELPASQVLPHEKCLQEKKKAEEADDRLWDSDYESDNESDDGTDPFEKLRKMNNAPIKPVSKSTPSVLNPHAISKPTVKKAVEKQQPAAGAGAGVVNAPVNAPREKPNAGAGQPPGVTPEPQAQQPIKSDRKLTKAELKAELNKRFARVVGVSSDYDSDDNDADYEDGSDDEQVDSKKYASKFISHEQVEAFLLSASSPEVSSFTCKGCIIRFVALDRFHQDASSDVERFVSAIKTEQTSGIPIEQFHLMLNQLLAYPAKHSHWTVQDERNHKRIYRELVAALRAQKQRDDESKESEGNGVINFILTGQGDVEGRQWLRSLHNALIYGDPDLENSVSRLEQELAEEQTRLAAEKVKRESSVAELNSLQQEQGAISIQLQAALDRLTNLNLELQPYAVDSTMVQETPSTITPMVTVQQEPMRSPEALAEQGEASVALSSPALPVTTVSEGVNVSGVVDHLTAYANPGCCFHWRNWTKEAKAIKEALENKNNVVTQAELLAILNDALSDGDRLLKPQGTSLGVSKFTKILVDLVNAVAGSGSLDAEKLIQDNKTSSLKISDFLAEVDVKLTPVVEQTNRAVVDEVKAPELMESAQPVAAAAPMSPAEQRRETLLAQHADADAHVARLNAELESLNGRIQDAQSQITQHEGRIAKHEQRIPELNASLEAAHQQLAVQKEQIQAQKELGLMAQEDAHMHALMAAEAEAKAQAEREAQARREAEEAARKAAEEEAARREAEAKAQAEREAQAKREAEEAARLEAEAKAQAEREKRGKRAAEKPALVAQVKAPAQPKRKAIRKPVPAVPVAANTDLPQPAAAPTVSAPFNDAFAGASAAAGVSRVPLAGAGGDHYSVSTDASSVKDALVMKPAHAVAAGGYISVDRFKLLVAELLENKDVRHTFNDNRITFLTDRCNEKQGLSLTLVQAFVNELCDSKKCKSVRDALRADINNGKIKGKRMSSDLRALLPAAEFVTYKKPGLFGSHPKAEKLASLLATLRAMKGELDPSVAPV